MPGRRTIMQWNTAELGVDYRIGPRETRIETYTWSIPEDVSPGELHFEAVMQYRKLVKSVGDFMDVPDEETATIIIGEAGTRVAIVD